MPEEGVSSPAEIVPPPVLNTEPKMWYRSIEMWTSIVAIVAFILQGIYGNFIVPADVQAAVVSLVMLVLRVVRQPRPIALSQAHFEQLKSVA